MVALIVACLFISYHSGSGRGVKVDEEKTKYYLELAAMKGRNANEMYTLSAR